MNLAVSVLLIAAGLALVLWAVDRISDASKEAKRIHDRNKK